MKTYKLIPLILLAGCSTIVSGKQQSISVTTTPPSNCKLVNDKGTWFVNAPGTITVNKSYNDMNVDCKSGSKAGTNNIKSNVDPWIFGNILLGGIIGLGVDFITGAGFNYPTPIDLPLK